MKEDKKRGPSEYEIKDWARTCLDAAEIMADPEKMKHVQKHIDHKKKAMKSLDDVRARVAKGG